MLAAHVVVSVGWLGVVAAMLVLSVSAATTDDAGTAEAAYVLIGEVSDVLVAPPPASLGLAALLTGVVLSVGAKWGLFGYYWIVVKLALTVAVIVSGVYLVDGWIRQAGALAGEATGPVTGPVTGSAPGPGLGSSPVLLIYASAIHLLMLGAATVISVYKPWGKTGRGARGAL